VPQRPTPVRPQARLAAPSCFGPPPKIWSMWRSQLPEILPLRRIVDGQGAVLCDCAGEVALMAKRQDDPTPMTKATERQGSPLQLQYNSHCILIDGRHSVLDKSNGCLTGSRYNPQYHHHHQQEVGHHEPDWFHHGGFMRSARCAISNPARRWPSWRHSDGLNCCLRHHAAATAVDE